MIIAGILMIIASIAIARWLSPDERNYAPVIANYALPKILAILLFFGGIIVLLVGIFS
jgi:hypothetical protein